MLLYNYIHKNHSLLGTGAQDIHLDFLVCFFFLHYRAHSFMASQWLFTVLHHRAHSFLVSFYITEPTVSWLPSDYTTEPIIFCLFTLQSPLQKFYGFPVATYTTEPTVLWCLFTLQSPQFHGFPVTIYTTEPIIF